MVVINRCTVKRTTKENQNKTEINLNAKMAIVFADWIQPVVMPFLGSVCQSEKMTPILGVVVTVMSVTHRSDVKPMALRRFGGRRRHYRRSPRCRLEKRRSGTVSSNWKDVFWRLWIFWRRCCATADVASVWASLPALSPPVGNAVQASFEDRSDVVLASLLRHCRRRQPCVLYDTILVLFGDRKNIVPTSFR